MKFQLQRSFGNTSIYHAIFDNETVSVECEKSIDKIGTLYRCECKYGRIEEYGLIKVRQEVERLRNVALGLQFAN